MGLKICGENGKLLIGGDYVYLLVSLGIIALIFSIRYLIAYVLISLVNEWLKGDE